MCGKRTGKTHSEIKSGSSRTICWPCRWPSRRAQLTTAGRRLILNSAVTNRGVPGNFERKAPTSLTKRMSTTPLRQTPLNLSISRPRTLISSFDRRRMTKAIQDRRGRLAGATFVNLKQLRRRVERAGWCFYRAQEKADHRWESLLTGLKALVVTVWRTIICTDGDCSAEAGKMPPRAHRRRRLELRVSEWRHGLIFTITRRHASRRCAAKLLRKEFLPNTMKMGICK